MSSPRNFRAAHRAYVEAHDRVWERNGKLGAPASDAGAEVEFGRLPASPRFGVNIPERLDFRRGPATQRDPLPGADGS